MEGIIIPLSWQMTRASATLMIWMMGSVPATACGGGGGHTDDLDDWFSTRNGLLARGHVHGRVTES